MVVKYVFFFFPYFNSLHICCINQSIYLVGAAKELSLLGGKMSGWFFLFVSESNKCFAASSIIVPQKFKVSMLVA